MFLEILAIAVALFVAIKILFKSPISENDRLSHVPGPKGIPILGNIELGLKSNEQILDVFAKYISEYGRRYKFNLGPVTVLVISNAKDAEKIMSSSVHIGKSQDYRFYSMWLGGGLLTSSGSKWHSRRKLLTPAFHFKILEDFLPLINHHSQTLVQRIQSSHTPSTTFDIYPIVAQASLDMICETAMGIRLDSTKECDTNYCDNVKQMNQYMLHRIFSPWLHPELLWSISPTGRSAKAMLKKLHGFTMNVIKNRKATLQTSGPSQTTDTPDIPSQEDILKIGKVHKRRAFLDLLLETQHENPDLLSDEDVREEVDTFMFEGHDTTSSCISWTVYLLGVYPMIQDKVREELDEIFGEDRTRPVTLEDLNQMKYLEMTIKESLRIYSTVPFVGRKLTHECRLDSETLLPPNTTVWIHLYFIHKDPSVYPDPLEFNPERFAPDVCVSRDPYDFVPFSAGPRNCIGQRFAMMEVKTALSSIFRNFSVKSVEPREDIVIQCEAILKPKNGVRVQVIPRT